MTLRSFLNKYEDLSKELLRCNGCTNILLHSGKNYEIVKIGLNEEGILCETCQRNKRNLESVTRISKDNNQQIFRIPISAVVQDIPFNKDSDSMVESESINNSDDMDSILQKKQDSSLLQNNSAQTELNNKDLGPMMGPESINTKKKDEPKQVKEQQEQEKV